MAAIQPRSAAPFSKNRCKSPFNIEIWERENGDISLVVSSSSSSSRAAADEKVSLDSDVSARYKIDGWNSDEQDAAAVAGRAGAAPLSLSRLAHYEFIR